jgi:adenylate cyclase
MASGPWPSTGETTAEAVNNAFRAESITGLKLNTVGRLVSLAVIAVLIAYLAPHASVLYYEALLMVFALIGLAHYMLVRQGYGGSWLGYSFVTLDFALLTFTLFVPNPFAPWHEPPQAGFRNDPIVYYFLLIASVAFSYTPKLMLWAGCAAGLGWTAGVMWLLSLPDTHTPWDYPPRMTPAEHLASHLDPHFVDTHLWIQNLILILLVAGILALVVRRSYALVTRQAAFARERAALSRYFSPNVLDELMQTGMPFTTVRKHEVAILFADIVGFTHLCETMAPEDTMDLLREYHSRLEAEVFRFGGTLDKFIGDAVMASFGAPRPGLQDATDSLSCAYAMLQSMTEWNDQRQRLGEEPIRIGIGIHHGPAVMGDVGSERCAAFAVIGDTTNTTSRLQSLTRDLQVDIVASQALLDAVRRETPEADQVLRGFRDAGMQAIRGRQKAMHIWMLDVDGMEPDA